MISKKVALIFFLLCTITFAQQTPPLEVVNAAKKIKEFAIESISEADYHRFGLKNVLDKYKVEMGQAYEMAYVDDDVLKAASDTTEVDDILLSSDLWYFEAQVQGEFKFLYIVAFHEGKWQIVSAGLDFLTDKIRSVRKSLLSRGENSKIKIGKSYLANNYVFNLESLGKKNLTILKQPEKDRSATFSVDDIKTTSDKLYK